MLYLNFLKGVSDHSNKHVEQDDDDDEGEDAVENPSNKLCEDVLRHVHIVLVGHTKHGPEQEVEGLVEPVAAQWGVLLKLFVQLEMGCCHSWYSVTP